MTHPTPSRRSRGAHRLLPLALLAATSAAAPAQTILHSTTVPNTSSNAAVGQEACIVGDELFLGGEGFVQIAERQGDSIRFTQRLLSPLGGFSDYGFGRVLDAGTDVIVVGAYGEKRVGNTRQGRVYVFEPNGPGRQWQNTAVLEDSLRRFGSRVAVSPDGTQLAVSDGLQTVYFYRRVAGTWIQEFSDGSLPFSYEQHQVLIEGNEAFVSSPLADELRAYRFENGGWQLAQTFSHGLPARDAHRLGWSLDRDGERLIAGMPYYEDGSRSLYDNTGGAMVFRFDGNEWVAEQALLPEDLSQSTYGGWSVAIEGDTALLGCYGLNIGWDRGVGTVQVWRNDGAGFAPVARMFPPWGTPPELQYFGKAVDMDGPTWLIGASGSSANGFYAGSVHLARPELVTDTGLIGTALGGQQNFDLALDPALAGAPYLLVGSASGTTPGFRLFGQTIPLVPDGYLVATAAMANSPLFRNSSGVLDAEGRARMTLDLPPGLAPAGLVLHHAALVLPTATTPFHVTGPREVRIR